MSLARRVYDADTDARRLATNPIYWFRWLAADVGAISKFRYSLVYLVSSQLRVRYQRSALGFLWTLLNPLLNLAVLAAVFSLLLNRPLRTFTLYLFAGLVPWQFFSATLTNGAGSLVAQQMLIRKMYVPKLLFPLSAMLINAVNMAFAMTAMFLLLQVIRAPISPRLLLLPIVIPLLMTFALGVSLMLMVLNTFYRDVEHMITVVLRAWYFLSPILWKPEMVLGKNRWFDLAIALNPMTHFLEMFHFVFSCEGYERWPAPGAWAAVCGLALGSLLLGYLVYKKYEDKLIFRL